MSGRNWGRGSTRKVPAPFLAGVESAAIYYHLTRTRATPDLLDGVRSRAPVSQSPFVLEDSSALGVPPPKDELMGTELDENPKGQGRRHPDFALLLDRFHATIDGILAVVDAISEPIAELDRSRTEPLRLKFGPGEEERFQKFLKNWGRQGRKGGATGPSPEGELPETPPSQGGRLLRTCRGRKEAGPRPRRTCRRKG